MREKLGYLRQLRRFLYLSNMRLPCHAFQALSDHTTLERGRYRNADNQNLQLMQSGDILAWCVARE